MKLNTTIIIINDTNNSDMCLAVTCDMGCHRIRRWHKQDHEKRKK